MKNGSIQRVSRVFTDCTLCSIPPPLKSGMEKLVFKLLTDFITFGTTGIKICVHFLHGKDQEFRACSAWQESRISCILCMAGIKNFVHVLHGRDIDFLADFAWQESRNSCIFCMAGIQFSFIFCMAGIKDFLYGSCKGFLKFSTTVIKNIMHVFHSRDQAQAIAIQKFRIS